MKRKGIDGKLLEWFNTYLLDIQRVILDRPMSTAILVEADVPKGSILGPLLFHVHMDDIVLDIDPIHFHFTFY